MENKEAVEKIEQQQSVKIAISQKNMWSGEVKCYSENIDDAMKSALEKAEKLESLIKEKNNGDK